MHLYHNECEKSWPKVVKSFQIIILRCVCVCVWRWSWQVTTSTSTFTRLTTMNWHQYWTSRHHVTRISRRTVSKHAQHTPPGSRLQLLYIRISHTSSRRLHLISVTNPSGLWPSQASFRCAHLGIYIHTFVSMRSHVTKTIAACFAILRQL